MRAIFSALRASRTLLAQQPLTTPVNPSPTTQALVLYQANPSRSQTDIKPPTNTSSNIHNAKKHLSWSDQVFINVSAYSERVFAGVLVGVLGMLIIEEVGDAKIRQFFIARRNKGKSPSLDSATKSMEPAHQFPDPLQVPSPTVTN